VKFTYRIEAVSDLHATRRPYTHGHEPDPGAGGVGYFHEHLLTLLNDLGREGWLFCGVVDDAWLVFMKEAE